MVYSILTEAKIKGSVADLQPTERAYSTFWLENGNLEGWTTIIDLDIVGVWNSFLFGTKREATTGFIGPTLAFPAVDARVNERIFFRLKYDKHPKNINLTNLGKIQFITVSDPTFNDAKSVQFEVFPDSKWHFYELNMAEISTWVGEITNVRFFPCINGARNDEFFLNFFEIGSNVFDFSFENVNAGLPGTATSGKQLTGGLEIIKDNNDRLVVNIDGYGNVSITLTPQTASPKIIARDISLQLGKVGIGGYIRAEASIDSGSQRMIIESGIKASDSTVRITDSPQSAGFTLGFLDQVGTFIGITQDGTAPSSTFEPLSAYRPTTLEILALFDNDMSLPAFTLDPQTFVVEGGRRDFGTTNKKLTHDLVVEGRGTDFQGESIQTEEGFDGQAKTLIDINHPFTDDGELEKIFINGIPDTGGASKWKIFRPKLDGTLTLVADGSIGTTPALGANEVLSSDPGIFVVDISTQDVNVRRGDLLGIFNADLHAGAYGIEKVDALYYQITGETIATFIPPAPSGAGEAGLPIYARGRITKNKAVVDIDLQKRLNLDTIKVSGFEDARDLEYNIAQATSSTFSVDILGNHEICYNIDDITRVCFPRVNTVFNIAALNDNVIFAENGIAGFGSGGAGGLGGADADGATYFYINGDGEFLNINEFVGQSAVRYEFSRDPYGIDCFFSSSTPRLDKPVGKAIIFFKDKKNQRAWQIETSLTEGARGGDGSKSGFQLVPSQTIDAIEFDNTRITPPKGFITTKTSAASDLLLDNPVILDVIAADGTRNPQKGIDFIRNAGELGGVNVREQATFIELQWNRYQWEFDAIRTIAFRWFCDFHFSTKISEFQIFAVSTSVESLGDNNQILFSSDGNTFTTAELLTSNETEAEYKLGGSPQFIRLVFRPTLPLSIADVQVGFEEDQVCFGKEGRILGAINIADARVGSAGEACPLLITNNTNQAADLILDIPADIQSTKQLLYFSRLNNSDEIIIPQIGPPGRIDFNQDKILGETENIAQKAHAYGLLSLASGTANTFRTTNFFINPGFETGDLTGWNLETLVSGTKLTASGSPFQTPRVFNSQSGPDEDAGSVDSVTGVQSDMQQGDFVFGFSIDVAHKDQGQGLRTDNPPFGGFTPVSFNLNQTVDVSEFAQEIDTGQAFAIHTIGRYQAYFVGSLPNIMILGAPTVSGANADPGTVISEEFGTNTLRSQDILLSNSFLNQSVVGLGLAVDVTIKARLKIGTRFIRTQLFIDATSEQTFIGGLGREKWLSDDHSLVLEIPAVTTAKWYKNWRDGLADPNNEFNGWTDSNFSLVTEFVSVTGSQHWFQPFCPGCITGIPGDGTGGTVVQTQGFNNVFLADRFLGIQSYEQMTITNPGELGAQWSGEKEIAGIRIGFHHNSGASTFNAEVWPRTFQFEVLRTKADLGINPDINNPNHFKIAGVFRNVDAEASPSSVDGVPPFSPETILTTWLLTDGPVTTEGIRIMFTRNCDKLERNTHPNTTAFSNLTGCPPDNQTGASFNFLSKWGLAVTYFVPLESTNNTNLPIDNVQETHVETVDNSRTNVYAAVNLGRHHDINIDTDLFELISTTPSQSEWNVSSVLFSGNTTDNPNEVVWAGSSSNAKWIRFTSNATVEWEDQATLREESISQSLIGIVDQIPQAILNQARIYPNLATTLFSTEGYNTSWQDLGTDLTDNKTSTFINYSDFPIIALDLGRTYIIDNDASVIRKRHDTVGPNPDNSVGSLDKNYWDGDDENNWTYSVVGSSKTSRPETVAFRAFGAGVPDIPVRWVAVKGSSFLLTEPGGDPAKTYNFNTPGGVLFYLTIRPRSSEVITENPQWFTNTKTILNDISTFNFSLGNQIDHPEDGRDFGSSAGAFGNSTSISANNLGPPFQAFDGIFDRLAVEFEGWGIQVRDIETGLDNAADDFPHSIWRIFRNLVTEANETKSVKAITLLGFDEDFHPTNFIFQELEEDFSNNIKDPNLDTSWSNIANSSFNSIDTYQEGFGFTHIFPEAIKTKGIRVKIISSVFPDDSVESSTNIDGIIIDTFPQTSGPQTRVAKIIIYEEISTESAITGNINVNHMASATVTSLTATPDHEITKINDGDISSFWQSTGFNDIITISLFNKRPITRLEWAIDPNLAAGQGTVSTNAPHNFSLNGTVNGIDTELLVGSGIIAPTFSEILEDAPVTAKDFTFNITLPQGSYEDASSIWIHELRLIEEIIQTIPLITVGSVSTRRPGGINNKSTKITYAANADAIATITVDGLNAGNDILWSTRDFFNLWMFISDVSLLDTSFGNIKLGNDNNTFYRWDFRNENLVTGWNELKLQFRTADDISEVQFQPGLQFREDTGESQVDFITADVEVTSSVDGNFSQRVIEAPGIRFFEIEFRGIKGSEELEIYLDEFKFQRNTFDDVCKFGKALYLNNNELYTIFLEGLDISTGTVEFWFQPDWDTSGKLNLDTSIIPALFRIMRPDGKFLSLFYRPNQGFIVMIYDGNQLLQFVTFVSAYRFTKFQTFHVGLVWDAQRRISGAGGQNASITLYIDGNPVYGSDVTWDAIKEGGASVILGGEVGQLFAATPDNPTAILFTAVPTASARNTASTWGLIENIRIYNYPRSDFSDINLQDPVRNQLLTPSEMIEISISGTLDSFVELGSSQLPLVVRNISAGNGVTVYIRTILPKNLTGDESRDASLLVRWKTPLKECN